MWEILKGTIMIFTQNATKVRIFVEWDQGILHLAEQPLPIIGHCVSALYLLDESIVSLTEM